MQSFHAGNCLPHSANIGANTNVYRLLSDTEQNGRLNRQALFLLANRTALNGRLFRYIDLHFFFHVHFKFDDFVGLTL